MEGSLIRPISTQKFLTLLEFLTKTINSETHSRKYSSLKTKYAKILWKGTLTKTITMQHTHGNAAHFNPGTQKY